MVLICISLIAKEVEHVLKCFLAIQSSSVVNSLFSSVPHFLTGLIRVLASSFLSSLYILEIRHLSDEGLVKISVAVSQETGSQPTSGPSNSTLGNIPKRCPIILQKHLFNYVHSLSLIHI